MGYSRQLFQIWYSEGGITYAFNEQAFRSRINQFSKLIGTVADHESSFDPEPR